MGKYPITQVIGHKYICDITQKEIKEEEIFYDGPEGIISIEAAHSYPPDLREPRWMMHMRHSKSYPILSGIMVIVDDGKHISIWEKRGNGYNAGPLYQTLDDAREDIERNADRIRTYYLIKDGQLVEWSKVKVITEKVAFEVRS